jgi:hypothetical protein
MKQKQILLFLLAVIMITRVTAQSPNVFAMDVNRLVELKEKIRQKDKEVLQLIDSLKKQANGLLKMKPVSVMDKEFTPVSGNKHDYMSQAPYFWYDSTKPNGLPYIRKDGVRNPEIYKITDRTYIGRLENASRILSLAWYLTGDTKYADKTAALLRHWFINEATKMNPHLEYGQAIPGVNNGRGVGIIETRNLIGIADAVGLLEGSASWTKSDSKAMQEWYAKYLDWLLTSKNGKDEHAAKNNHGTWYYAQAIDFALFTGNKELAKKLAEESKKRLDSQLTKEGQQPLELARTNALGYSTMNLQGWLSVATLAEKTGVDLWNYKTPEGASIKLAIAWLLPYAVGDKKWTYQQISPYNEKDIYTLLLQAGNKFEETSYKVHTEQTPVEEINDVIIELLYKK